MNNVQTIMPHSAHKKLLSSGTETGDSDGSMKSELLRAMTGATQKNKAKIIIGLLT